MDTKIYRVIFPLNHDNTLFPPGSRTELSDEHARPLLADGVIDGPVEPAAPGESAGKLK